MFAYIYSVDGDFDLLSLELASTPCPEGWECWLASCLDS